MALQVSTGARDDAEVVAYTERMQLFQVKICGIKSVADALVAVRAGADAVGLNFYQQTPRFIPLAVAAEIVSALPEAICKVGVFVNASAEQMKTTARQLNLDLLQLHGDEPPEVLSQLGELPVVRAYRVGSVGMRPLADYLERCQKLGRLPDALLLDACRPGLYGGTGETVDWEILGQVRHWSGDLPVILAGGLRPDNIARAIAAVHPDAVDTASGVEREPGKKDPQLVRDFVVAAREALQRQRCPKPQMDTDATENHGKKQH